MQHVHAKLLAGTMAWFVLALALPGRGQNVAQPAWRGHFALASRGHPGLALLSHRGLVAFEMQGRDALATAEVPQGPVIVGNGPLQPVTVEHRGRLLVLNYGPQPGSGGLLTKPGPRGAAPGFVIFQGQRPIVTGRFEYG